MLSMQNTGLGGNKMKLSLITLCLILLAGAISWVHNIFMLVSCDWIITAEEVLRVVGIFIPPLGAVLGFVGHF